MKLVDLIKSVLGNLLPLAVLAAAVFVTWMLFKAKPEVPKAVRVETAVFVETRPVRKVARQVYVEAFGTVVPHRELEVQTQVAGRVVRLHDNLTEGGLIAAGQELVKVDDRDYLFEVQQAQARMATAQAQLDLEMGRQAIAKRELELLRETVERAGADSRLALRTPYLEERKAEVAAAKSQAEFRDVQFKRTAIKAPFDAIVMEEEVETDRLLTMGARLARLVATDTFRVVVSLPAADLDYVQFPNAQGQGGSAVRVRVDLGRGKVSEWSGRVSKLLAGLSDAGRLARVLVLVDDPLSLRPEHAGRPRLLLGSYVQVRIDGPELGGVIPIARSALRLGDTVWLMNDEQRLEVRSVEVARRTADEAWIVNGLDGSERLVVSALSVSAPGLLLADGSEEKAAPDEAATEGSDAHR